jgi:hypothetical protein
MDWWIIDNGSGIWYLEPGMKMPECNLGTRSSLWKFYQ